MLSSLLWGIFLLYYDCVIAVEFPITELCSTTANHHIPATGDGFGYRYLTKAAQSSSLRHLTIRLGKKPSFYIRKIIKAIELWSQSCQRPWSLTHEESKKTITKKQNTERQWRQRGRDKNNREGKRKNRSEGKEAEKGAEERSENGAEGGRWVRETLTFRYMMQFESLDPAVPDVKSIFAFI